MTASKLPVDTSATALDMADAMFGAGITIVSATYSGDALSSGVYSDGTTVAPGSVPADSGVVLSTGLASDFTNDDGEPTNAAGNTSTNTAGGVDGDPLLSGLVGRAVYDAAILEAEFIPTGDILSMQLVFGSEEYLEWVNSGYNDVVGIWINGEKAELTIGDGDISIDNINETSNQNLFIDNTSGVLNSEMDGLTVVLTVKAEVNVGEVNSIRIGIADDGDSIYDSNLLIVGDSVQTAVIAQDDAVWVARKSERTIDLRANDTADDDARVSQINGVDVTAGDIVDLQTGESVRLNADGTITVFAAPENKESTITYTLEADDGTNDIAFLTITTSPVDGTDGDDLLTNGFTDVNGQIVDGSDGVHDVIMGYGGNDKIFAGDGDDDVYGGTGNDFIRTGAGEDLLEGGDGDDVLDGGLGNDVMSGGDGDDLYYVYDVGDILTGETGGHDKVKSAFDHTLGSEFEDLWLIEGSAARDGTGNARDNSIVGNSAANTLSGNAGNDEILGYDGADVLAGGTGMDKIHGGAGNDTITGDDGADKLFGNDGDDNIAGGLGNDTICAGAGEDILNGGDGDDILGGGGGADTMTGGLGDDEYVVENTGDVVIEAVDEGYDRVRASVDFTLSENVEKLLMEGAAITGTGNAGANTVIGNALSNVLSGLDGNDRLVGANGDDVVDGGNGNDSVDGGSGSDTLSGGTGNDKLKGGSGADILNGGAGADRLAGGWDADVFQFATGDGKDVLYDFETDVDTLEFHDIEASDVSAEDYKKGILLTYGATDSIYMLGVTAVEFDTFDIQYVEPLIA